MPIKLPKTFARRKSAGNLLEAHETHSSESSFRVLNREEVAEHGSSRDSRMKRRVAGRPKSSSPLRHYSSPSADDEHFLSYRTNKSNSTEGASSSSARHSYQSTEPSSVESASHDDLKFNRDQAASQAPRATFQPEFFDQDRPGEQPGFSTSMSKKRFTIPRPKFGTSNSASQRRESESTETWRDRSQTVTSHAGSYASTAMPPQVDLGLNLGGVSKTEESIAWFEGLGGDGRSPIMEEPSSFAPPEAPKPIFRSESDSMLGAKKQFSFEESDDRPLPLSQRLSNSPRPDRYAPRSVEDNSWRVDYSPSNVPRRQDSSPPTASADTQLLLDAAYASQALERQHGFRSESVMDRSRGIVGSAQAPRSEPRREPQTPFGNRYNRYEDASARSTPRGVDDESDSLFENSPASTVLHHVNEAASAPPKGNKVMTPAEFELAKRSAEASKDDDDTQSQASDEADMYEDEDETERNRQVAKQRRKQEAHLSVYRQQMMKVTGEQPTDLPERPKLARFSQSVPNFAARPSSTPGKTGLEGEHAGKSDDSDDEIPLGVLQAHGFPTRSRPPTRMADHPSPLARPSTHVSSYPAPPGSTRNDPSTGGGGSGSLPPFARNLPSDPYVGASLVNHTNRESLSYNTQSSAGRTASASLPPGGLVGVIAGEEHARAMRRGSPNTNGVYGPTPPQPPMGYPGTPQQQVPNPMNNMNGQLPFSPSEQAQMEMSNQMTQMMQMQMQWMQQMMQMQALSQQTGTPMPPMPQMPQMPFMANQMQAQPGAQQPNFLNPQQRQSSASTFGPGHQRASSSMSGYMNGGQSAPSVFGVMPTSSVDGVQGQYAPSIAPSERSNVGQPSRYRPVTPANVASTRTSTLSLAAAPAASQSTYGQLHNPRGRSPVKSQPPYSGQFDGPESPYASAEALNMSSTIRAVSRPKKGVGGGVADASDEEDSAGWEEMKRKREARKSRWRPRRNTGSRAQSQATAGLEALYYEGPTD